MKRRMYFPSSRYNLVCPKHGSASGCKRGSKCKLSHSYPESIPLCPTVFKKQKCRYGQNCSLRHTTLLYLNNDYQNHTYIDDTVNDKRVSHCRAPRRDLLRQMEPAIYHWYWSASANHIETLVEQCFIHYGIDIHGEIACVIQSFSESTYIFGCTPQDIKKKTQQKHVTRKTNTNKYALGNRLGVNNNNDDDNNDDDDEWAEFVYFQTKCGIDIKCDHYSRIAQNGSDFYNRYHNYHDSPGVLQRFELYPNYVIYFGKWYYELHIKSIKSNKSNININIHKKSNAHDVKVCNFYIGWRQASQDKECDENILIEEMLECKSGDIVGVSIICKQIRKRSRDKGSKKKLNENYYFDDFDLEDDYVSFDGIRNINNDGYEWLLSYRSQVFKNGKSESRCHSQWYNKRACDKIGLSPLWCVKNVDVTMRAVFEPQWMKYKMPNGSLPLCATSANLYTDYD